MKNRVITIAAVAAALAVVPAQGALAGVSTSPGAFQEQAPNVGPATAGVGTGTPSEAPAVDPTATDAPEVDETPAETPDETGAAVELAAPESQSPTPEAEQAPEVGVAQKTEGKASGDGPATDEECSARAAFQDAMWDVAALMFVSGDYEGSGVVEDSARDSQDEGVDRGCVFTVAGGGGEEAE